MKSIDPFSNKVIKEYQEDSAEQLKLKIEKSHETFTAWKATSFETRTELMRDAAAILRDRKEELARLMTTEMGKPILSSEKEIEKCAWVCEYYAENAKKFLTDEHIKTEATESFITYQPLGSILAIMPWNFPFWQVFRFAAPTLMAGNTAVLKHSSLVPGCALAIEEIFNKAGFPKNVFSTLLIGSKQVAGVISNPIIKAVTLTGSTEAGKKVAKTAGENLKKCVLELGGSDPYIILSDANIESAADQCVTSRMINNGQSCIAAKRFIVVEDIYDDFIEQVLIKMKDQVMGNPMSPQTTLGPLASKNLRDQLHLQVQKSSDRGAKLLLGGFVPEMQGAFYPPTVLADVSSGMPAYDDELFGPVASIIKVKNEVEAIAIANDTCFGLGAAIFSSNLPKAREIAKKKLDAGCCFVNEYVRSDPRLPFGGINESGFGRELSYIGIREFVNIKTIVLK